jgi:Flp pilus assembly protein TadG
LVEFALILIPLLMLVGGIIYFGIGLNRWLDMNRVANQGARQAVVNNWPPQCVRNETPGYNCNSSNSTTPCSTVMAANSAARLQDVLRCQTRANATVTICFPGKNPGQSPPNGPTTGDPVRVQLTSPYKFFFFDSFRVNLKANATMRLERRPMASITAGAGGPICS